MRGPLGGGLWGRNTQFSPASVPGLAVWLDGAMQAFSDLAGTVPANPTAGRARRINEPAPLSGFFSAPSDAERPYAETNGLALEPVIPQASGYNLTLPAGVLLPVEGQTLVMSMSLRFPVHPNLNEGWAHAFGTSGFRCGPARVQGEVWVYANGNHWSTGVFPQLADLFYCVIRFKGAAGIDMSYSINGAPPVVISTATVVTADTWAPVLGIFDGFDGAHMSFGQFAAYSNIVSDANRDKLIAWLPTRPVPPAFPVDYKLVLVTGDSIAFGLGVNPPESWPFVALPHLQDVAGPMKLANVAIQSQRIADTLATFAAVWPVVYSASRAKNVATFDSATNDIAFSGQPIGNIIAAYLAGCDTMRAAGAAVVADTVLPRSDTGISVTFEADRQTFNTAIRAGAAHYNALSDVATVPGMGAAGDSTNATNYQSDQVHPTAVGQALIEPTYRAAILTVL